MQIAFVRRFNPTMMAALLAAGTFVLGQSAVAQQAPAQHRLSAATVAVQGAVSTVSGDAAGTFSGLLKLTNFSVQNGQLVASGLLTGTITNTDSTTQAVSQTVTGLLVNSASAGCPVLNLALGPLHLNVLGLVIDLNQVNLNIVAIPGAGNLLGNLLCDVANLLNGGGPLSVIVTDLNKILAAL